MKKIVALILALVLVLALGCFVYVSDVYFGDAAALAAMAGNDRVTVQDMDGNIVFRPQNPTAGLLFYPGGKVEPDAYAPLLLALAEQDILSVLIPMPCNLAVLNPGAAEGVAQQFPEIENWYIGGHSLGGSMAASYAGKHPQELEGLILLAAYATDDLRESGLRVLSLYGENDGVLNGEKYESYRPNLPENTVEIIIPGGNHAFFGSYGPQKGDGEATISSTQQTQFTAAAVKNFLQ